MIFNQRRAYFFLKMLGKKVKLIGNSGLKKMDKQVLIVEDSMCLGP